MAEYSDNTADAVLKASIDLRKSEDESPDSSIARSKIERESLKKQLLTKKLCRAALSRRVANTPASRSTAWRIKKIVQAGNGTNGTPQEMMDRMHCFLVNELFVKKSSSYLGM